MKPVLASAVLGAACLFAFAAAAQTSQSPAGSGARSQSAAAQKAPAKSPAAAAKSTGDGAPAAEGQLRQRVEQLEEQLVDLQVAIGTLESLGRAGPAAGGGRNAAPASLSGPEAGRVAALETQMQALTVQVEQMSDQLRALRGGQGGGLGGAPVGSAGTYRSMPNAPAPAAGGFGQATVSPGNDPIGQLITTPDPRQPPARQAAATVLAPTSPATSPQAVASSAGSRQLYESSYTQLLQQNYAAAESGFSEFLQRCPSDELAANAQFWLGETYFVRGQWDAAGEAFLKVVKSYGNSAKAPDSLAKLAMSFERKGNKPAACRALAELNTRYPNPPSHVKTWEAAERRRAGCA